MFLILFTLSVESPAIWVRYSFSLSRCIVDVSVGLRRMELSRIENYVIKDDAK